MGDAEESGECFKGMVRTADRLVGTVGVGEALKFDRRLAFKVHDDVGQLNKIWADMLNQMINKNI